MRIKALELKGYKPLLLNSIETIEVDLVELFTLVLGSNGSGKSSLLIEASPLPAVPSDYAKGGYKRVHIEHMGVSYILTSTFTHGSQHSFIADGVELNGTQMGGYGTAKVQRELVESEFGYTVKLNKLLQGKVLFTKMSGTQRRDVLSEISPLDLKWALEFYRAIKTSARDSDGVLKHIIRKSTDARTDLSQLVYDDRLEREQRDLETQLNNLVPYTVGNYDSLESISDSVDSIIKELNLAYTNVRERKLEYVPDSAITDIDSLHEYRGTLLGKIETTRNTLTDLTTEQVELSNAAGELRLETLSISELEAQYIELTDSINKLSGLPTVPYVIYDGTDKLELVSQRLLELLSEYPNSTYIENNDCKDTIAAYDNVLVGIKGTENRLLELQAQLKHSLEDQSTATCPQCTFKFSLNGSNLAAQIDTLKERISKGEEYLRTQIGIRDSLRTRWLAVNDLNSITANYNSIRADIPLYDGFWDSTISIKNLLDNPGVLDPYIWSWRQRIKNKLDIVKLQESLDHCNDSIVLKRKYPTETSTRLASVEVSIQQELDKQQQLARSIEESDTIIALYNALSKDVDRCEQLLVRLDIEYRRLVDSTLYKDATDRCGEIYDRLAAIRQSVQEHRTLADSVTQLDKELEAIQSDHQIWHLIENHTSPVTGLIADQMLGFVNSYIHEMNRVIERIWAYELRINPITMDSGKLNYQLSLQVEGNLVPDLGLASTGQQDIINLAFVMVMREYFGIQEYPLYLDEVGASFDEEHRTLLMRYVNGLIGEGKCSQIFMINHYATIHGGLTNNDTVVLDDRNITVPDSYNENVRINEAK